MTFAAGILPGETRGVVGVIELAMEVFAPISEAPATEGVTEIPAPILETASIVAEVVVPISSPKFMSPKKETEKETESVSGLISEAMATEPVVELLALVAEDVAVEQAIEPLAPIVEDVVVEPTIELLAHVLEALLFD